MFWHKTLYECCSLSHANQDRLIARTDKEKYWWKRELKLSKSKLNEELLLNICTKLKNSSSEKT